MHALTVSQTASALARLEGLHTMLTLDEAIEVVTGKKPALVQRIRKKTTTMARCWLRCRRSYPQNRGRD
jgi:hypothetical protein